MAVVDPGKVGTAVQEIDTQIKAYKEHISGLQGNWEGNSYDKLKSEAGSFSSECNKISVGLNSFKSACAAYQEYEEAKAAVADCEAKIKEVNGYDYDDESVKQKSLTNLKNQLQKAKDDMDAAKKIIEESLSAAKGSKLGTAVGLTPTGTGTWAVSTGLPGQLGGTSGVLPNARIGEAGRPDPSTNKFFQNEANGGINGYPLNGRGIPGQDGNCTYYAYSRFSELLGHEATGIADGDACTWYNGTTAYKKGSTPKLGAIAVWQYGNSNSNGHVAVVEEIKDNGDIVVSEGGWSNNKWYGNSTFKKSNNYATGYSNGHLLGFIYPEEA